MIVHAKLKGDRKVTEFNSIRDLYHVCQKKNLYDKSYRMFCYELQRAQDIPGVKIDR